MSELQKRNAKAEKQLDANLELLGVDVSNVGDLNEKLTVLRETYEREWKAERKRMRTELQQMRDEARLEVRQLRGENADLARQVRDEQRRADKAEYSLIVQENEIMEWEEENQRKAEAWQQKQAQRNALAAEVARQQRDEEIAIAKRVAEKRVQKARDGRKMDELKRGIRQDAAALNQMVLRPSKGKYVSQRLIVQAAEVAKIADMTVLNDRAVNQLTRLQNSIQASMGSEGSPTAMTTEWEQTGVPKLITALQTDLTAWKDAKLADLQAKLAEAEALPYSEKALALQERLRKRIRETESRTYLPMTVDQMRMLKAITSATLHVIRNENKTVSLAKAEEVSKIADEAAYEVTLSKGNHPGGALDGLQNLLTKYNLDMLGAERVLRMLGGYKNGGQMEKIGQMLNDGQYRQTKITIEGEKLFADVTGAKHAKEVQAFAGPGADLVDVGLRDTDHNAVPLTHAQLCSLYMHLQNKDSREHLMTGGMVVPDAQLYSKGDVEQAYQKGQLVQLGMLSDGNGEAMADTILNTLEAAMTDYDRAWCADMKEFFGNYTTKLINETSLQLVGYKRATVQNYYPIAVDKAALATEIDGVKLDATIEGRGFLKNRVKSSKPILLEECSSVVQRSLRDTAAYAGLAAPIRDVQKILNAGVETRDGVKTLKNGVIKEQWGTKAVSYLDDLLTDLQTTQRHRSNGVSRMLSKLRGNYAGAVLTLNPGHCTGGEPADGGGRAGRGHHGVGDAICEKPVAEAEGGAGSGNCRARGRAFAVAAAWDRKRRAAEHRQAGDAGAEGHGQGARMADRVDQRHGRDHGGGPVGGQQSLCEEPRGGIRRRGRDRKPGILGGGEPHLPEGDRADPAELHRDAAGRHPAQPGRDGKDLYDVHDPALPECGHPDRRGGRLESAGGAVQGGRQRREQGRAAAGDKAAGPGHSEPGGAGGGVCHDEDRCGLPAAPVGPGAGRERRRDPEEHCEPLFLAVHREHDG